MDEAKTKEICRWLQKADYDLPSAERLFRGDPPTPLIWLSTIANRQLVA